MCPESLRRLLCHGREERVVGKMRMITKMQNVYDPRCYKDFGFYVMDGNLVGYSPWGHKESDMTERHLLYFTPALQVDSLLSDIHALKLEFDSYG